MNDAHGGSDRVEGRVRRLLVEVVEAGPGGRLRRPPSVSWTISFDRSGRKLEHSTLDSKGSVRFATEYRHRPDGLPASERTRDSRGSVVEETLYEYDSAGRLTAVSRSGTGESRIGRAGCEGTDLPGGADTYFSLDRGTDWGGFDLAGDAPIDRVEHIYDEKGALELVRCSARGRPLAEIRFIRNGSGRVIEERLSGIETGTVETVLSRHYVWTERGRVASIRLVFGRMSIQTVNMRYDSAGNCIERATVDRDGGQSVERLERKMDGRGNWIEERVWIGPTLRKLRLSRLTRREIEYF